MKTVEKVGRTKDEAIANALAELGVGIDRVNIRDFGRDLKKWSVGINKR